MELRPGCWILLDHMNPTSSEKLSGLVQLHSQARCLSHTSIKDREASAHPWSSLPTYPWGWGWILPLTTYTDPNPKSSQTATPRALGDSPVPVQLIEKRGYSVFQQQNLRSNIACGPKSWWPHGTITYSRCHVPRISLTHIISFNPLNSLMKVCVLLWSPFPRWGNWGPEKLITLTKTPSPTLS